VSVASAWLSARAVRSSGRRARCSVGLLSAKGELREFVNCSYI